MATLVLTVVGGAVAGPIGAAVGGMVGSAIDRRLFAPKRREGPRLTELRVQTSSYGTQVPRLFGTMRVAGTVFWATDVVERRSTSRAGKGGPKVTEYSYSANFAVLLSARPILEVRRIWADGQLLRGAAGDWKARTGFRLHFGGEEQAADPLIASAEGPDAPAARGMAYAVFEELELADFGNRIPSLTFEMVADPGPVGVGAIAEALAPEIDASIAATLDGFAASGGSVRAVVEALATAGGAEVAADGARLTLSDTPPRELTVADQGASADGRPGARRRALAPADTVPRTVTVLHYDPARDHQAGLQRAARPGPGGRHEQVELAAAVGAGAAKALAERVLSRAESGRVRRTVSLPQSGLAVKPGDGVRIAGEAGRWRVVAASCEGWATILELTPVEQAVAPAQASPGRVLSAPDKVVGRTTLHAFELPPTTGAAAALQFLVAASGGAGWRRAGLIYSLDDGASWVEAGATASPAVMGRVVEAPADTSALLIDRRSELVVELAGHMELGDADASALDEGANLALDGEELLQFGRAAPLGGGRWRLTELLRGRRGTEAAIGAAGTGAPFTLLEEGTIRAVPLPSHAIGRTVRVAASGVGDPEAAEISWTVDGRSVLPPAPVHLRIEPTTDGAARVKWTRRSRLGWAWIDGADAPLGEEREAYHVTVTHAGGVRESELAAPAATLTPAEVAGGPVLVSVRQRGDWGLGPAAELLVG